MPMVKEKWKKAFGDQGRWQSKIRTEETHTVQHNSMSELSNVAPVCEPPNTHSYTHTHHTYWHRHRHTKSKTKPEN